jgi:RNA polymerase sigma-70 factor (ECF subfamily)
VAANAAIDRIRRDGRLVAVEDDDAHPANGPDPLLHAESLGLLRRLGPIERTVVWLHAMEGWSHPELGRRFGRSESWSKSIVSRTLSRLRLELEEPHTHEDP